MICRAFLMVEGARPRASWSLIQAERSRDRIFYGALGERIPQPGLHPVHLLAPAALLAGVLLAVEVDHTAQGEADGRAEVGEHTLRHLSFDLTCSQLSVGALVEHPGDRAVAAATHDGLDAVAMACREKGGHRIAGAGEAYFLGGTRLPGLLWLSTTMSPIVNRVALPRS
jgi:hypothetical protein